MVLPPFPPIPPSSWEICKSWNISFFTPLSQIKTLEIKKIKHLLVIEVFHNLILSFIPLLHYHLTSFPPPCLPEPRPAGPVSSLTNMSFTFLISYFSLFYFSSLQYFYSSLLIKSYQFFFEIQMFYLSEAFPTWSSFHQFFLSSDSLIVFISSSMPFDTWFHTSCIVNHLGVCLDFLKIVPYCVNFAFTELSRHCVNGRYLIKTCALNCLFFS